MKINLKREIKLYNKKYGYKKPDAKYMTYRRLAGLTMCDRESCIETKILLLGLYNAGKRKHPDMELVWRIATTLQVTVDDLLKN